MIATVFPKVGAGNKISLINLNLEEPPRHVAALCVDLCSISYDYAARQKMGGTTVNYFVFKQFPVLLPTAFSESDLDFITPRVLELT